MTAMLIFIIVALAAVTQSDGAVLSKVSSWIRSVQSGSALGMVLASLHQLTDTTHCKDE